MELWSGDERVRASQDAGAETAFRVDDEGLARLAAADGVAGARLTLGEDGDLILSDNAGAELWRSGDVSSQEVAR